MNKKYYNFNDFTYIIRKNNDKSKRYKHWCQNCDKDRGYAHKNKILREPLCHSCKMATDEVKKKISKKSKQLVHSVQSKQKISESLYKTHNSSPILRTIKRKLRSRLNKAIHGNYRTGSAVRDLGCSVENLRIFIEDRFQPGMSWDNYGQWHIDHVKPLSKFNLTDKKELKKACHYSNLQPLWAKDNLKKSNKYES